MSVTVKIKPKGLFAKKLTLQDVLLEHMHYGIMDVHYRLEMGATGDYMTVYDTKMIARGYELHFEGKEIELRLFLPTSAYEIVAFYDYVVHICEKAGAKNFEREGEISTFDQIPQFIEDDKQGSLGGLKYIRENIESGKTERLQFFGALHPIDLGKKELNIIGEDLDKLGEFLNKMQQLDAYYAAPILYRQEDASVIGVYAITSDTRSIVPLKPSVPVVHNGLQVQEWYAVLGISEGEQATVRFEDFLNNIDKSNYYDAGHFLLTLSEREMRETVQKCQNGLQ